MSIKQEFSEAGKLNNKDHQSGMRGGGQQQQEKSNFSQTCNLLSQYLKEKGSFGDLSLGITRNLEGSRTENFRQALINNMNLTSQQMEMPSAGLRRNNSFVSASVPLSREVKSMDLFPHHVGFGPSPASIETIQRRATDFSSPKESETAQMTIFYAGKVIVFDDLPADKAKEIMLLASNSSPQNYSGTLFTSTPANDQQQFSNNFTTTIANNSNNIDLPPGPLQPDLSDLPLARKASLHRFLAKRKDRIGSKSPYQIPNSYSVSATAPKQAPINMVESKTWPAQVNTVESKTWLGLALQPSPQFGFQL